MAELRAEYSASSVDNEISDWRCDFQRIGHPPSVIMYPVLDFAELGEGEIASRLDDHALVVRSLEVTND